MRIDSEALFAAYSSDRIEPRYVVEMALDFGNTDLIYLTSHDDCDLPSTANSSNTFYSVLRNVQGTNQKLNPIRAQSTIGGGSFEVVDADNTLSDYLRDKWLDSKATTRKRVRTWVGAYGLEFATEYAIIGSKQKVNHEYDGLVYKFFLEDIQRSVKKDVHDERKTNLSRSITIDQVAIPATFLSKIASDTFELCWHDGNFTDSPNEEVNYIRINEDDNVEVIRFKAMVINAIENTSSDVSFSTSDWSVNSSTIDLSVYLVGMMVDFTGTTDGTNNISTIVKTSSANKLTLYALDGARNPALTTQGAGPGVTITAPVQFYQCARGVLNTRKHAVTVDADLSDARKPELTEHIYIETTLPKIDYATLTGVWYGTAYTLPSNWHLGIDTADVTASGFIDKTDLWNPADDTGKVYTFNGLQKHDAKQWLNEQVCRPMWCFNRVLNDGSIGLFRFLRVLHSSAYVAHLEQGDIVNLDSIKTDDSQIFNIFDVDWNYEPEKEGTTRFDRVVDQGSIDEHKDSSEPLSITLEGLHGSRDTVKELRDTFEWMRDSYSGPPILWNPTVMFKWNNLEIGDVIRVTASDIYDITNNENTYIDRSWMVLGKTVNWTTGGVKLNLFGSSQSADLIQWDDSANYQLADAFYSSEGTNLDTISGASLVGSVLHQTTDCTLTGNADINDPSAIYYSTTDYELNTAVTAQFTENTQLRIMGHLQTNGLFYGVKLGRLAGEAGWLGNTKSSGSFSTHYKKRGSKALKYNFLDYTIQTEGNLTSGTYIGIPHLDLKNAAGYLTGLPTDLRATSGDAGADLFKDGAVIGNGGAGARGPAALVIICRGMSFLGSGGINTSGSVGSPGDVYLLQGRYKIDIGSDDYPLSLAAGEGASSYPSPVIVIIDGAASVKPSNALVADFPSTPVRGARFSNAGTIDGLNEELLSVGVHHSYNVGSGSYDCRSSCFKVINAPAGLTPVADQANTADIASAFASVTETQNSPSTVAQNLSSVQVNLTPPSDTNYQYSNVYYKLSTQSADEYTLVGPALDSVVLPPTVMDGSTYDVIAKPVSKKGIESPDYVHTTVTVSSTTGGANMATGNYIAVGQTAFDTGTGAWIEKIASGVKASFGNSAGDKLVINNDAANIVDITGKVTATSGTIGGWTIDATTIDSAEVTLDSANGIISIHNTTFGANGIQLDANGGVPQIYCGNGTDKYFKYTVAGGPEYGKGTLKETVYEIYTSGVIRNTATPSSSGGFQIDAGYMRTWNSSGQQTYNLDFSDGSATLGYEAGGKYLKYDATANVLTVVSMQTAASGKRIELNPSSDNELHFYGDRGDTTVEELATIGITTSGSDDIIGNFGNSNSGNSRLAVKGTSYSKPGIYGVSYSVSAVLGISTNGSGVSGSSTGSSGVSGTSTNGTGAYGYSENDYGGHFFCGSSGLGPVRLGASGSASAPTHTAALGTLWVTSAGVLYINTSGSTTWGKVGAQ